MFVVGVSVCFVLLLGLGGGGGDASRIGYDGYSNWGLEFLLIVIGVREGAEREREGIESSTPCCSHSSLYERYLDIV